MASKQKILIVDDDNNIAELISLYLTKECYDTKIVNDGEEAVREFHSFQPNLILLDLMLPGMDGYQVCREIRHDSDVPIIMLSAKGEVFDKVLGLELGADDYITKPFSVRELAARVKSLLRRVAPQQESEPQTLRSGDIMIDITNYEAFKGGEKLSLTLKEFELLKVLVLSRGKVLTRDFLLDRIWGYEYYGETRTVDVHIRHLRQKLGEEPYIETVRGVGYRFVDREQEA